MSNCLYILVLLGLSLAACLAATKLQVGCDYPLCKCSVATKEFGALEFRIVCEGDGTQDLLLDDTVFKNESSPDFTRRMYARMTNFASLTVDSVFLTRWLAYTSCSLDIWNCRRTYFPTDTPPTSSAEAPFHQFADDKLWMLRFWPELGINDGIGVVNSDIIAFSPKIFRGKKEAGLKLSQSNVARLNIADFGAIDVNYFIANNSLIEILEGSKNNSIQLAMIPKNGNIHINIQNTTIGILKKGSLAFSDHKKGMRAKVEINKSTFGLAEEGAIHIGQNINLKVKQSYFGLIPPHSVVISEKGRMIMNQNVLRIQESALRDIVCNGDITISDNLVLPVDLLNRCLHTGFNVSNSCEDPDSNSSFIDSSCGENHIWPIAKTTTALPTTVADMTSTTTTTTEERLITTTPPIEVNAPNETTSIEPNVSSAEFLFQYRVPMGLFYLVIALCLALLFIVMVLTALVAWGKTGNKRSRKNRTRSECMYEEPASVYFAPRRVSSQLNDVTNHRDEGSNCSNIYSGTGLASRWNENDEPMYEEMNEEGKIVFAK